MTSPEVRVRVSKLPSESRIRPMSGFRLGLGSPFAPHEGGNGPKTGRSQNEGIPELAECLQLSPGSLSQEEHFPWSRWRAMAR
jgi:hypothetical protein